MTYTKRIKNDKIVALCTYNHTPTFSEDSGMVIISQEEYETLREEIRNANSRPKDPDNLSALQALAIITGEEDITNETE